MASLHPRVYGSEDEMLYVEGHNVKLGYVISRELIDAPPVRYYLNLHRARRFVDRYNRLIGRYAAALIQGCDRC